MGLIATLSLKIPIQITEYQSKEYLSILCKSAGFVHSTAPAIQIFAVQNRQWQNEFLDCSVETSASLALITAILLTQKLFPLDWNNICILRKRTFVSPERCLQRSKSFDINPTMPLKNSRRIFQRAQHDP